MLHFPDLPGVVRTPIDVVIARRLEVAKRYDRGKERMGQRLKYFLHQIRIFFTNYKTFENIKIYEASF